MSGKRKRSTKNYHRYRANPSRGGPGILLTCETSREIKCEREGREILRYYFEKEKGQSTQQKSQEDQEKSNEKLTLEQELENLRQLKHKDNGPFQLFDTGCAGTVFFLFVDKERETNIEELKKENGTRDETHSGKRIRASDIKDEEQTETAETNLKQSTSASKESNWDPVATVQAVARDIANGNVSTDIPASRFVTRMIPIQTTCFASLKELETVLPKLLRTHNNQETLSEGKSKKTFRVHIKKRQCNHISSQEFIDTAAPLAMNLMGWAVQLKDPDYIVHIEVCKTLMGISVFRRDDVNLAKNFNLAELRDKEAASTDKLTSEHQE